MEIKFCLFCASRCLRMLCVWIFLFLTSETIAQYKKEDDYRCIIPENDIVKNGNFSVIEWFGSMWKGEDDEQPPAGTKFLTYDLKFQCDLGFFLRGNLYVRCVPLDMGEFPVCSDTCEPSDPDCPLQGDGISSNIGTLTGSKDCGMVSNAPTALAGGRTAIPGDVPWQAAIYDKNTDPFMQICGGSIVSEDVVISAAHCFKLPDEFYAVAVGKIYRPYDNPMDRNAQKSEILEIRTPSRYRGSVTSFQDDIAAVILATPIRFTSMIHPVCLHFGADFDEVQLTPGKLGRVAGWGIDSQNGRPSQVLNLAEMPMVNIRTCFMLQDVSFIQYITSDKICAGYTNGTSLCKGDSGGGLAVPHRSGYVTRYYLRGVVSTGPPPATLNECNVNAVTTFTRVAKHEYFVKSAIAKKSLQESERRIPPIIPANFIKTNQNGLINNGVNDGLPLKIDQIEEIDVISNQEPIVSNSRNPEEVAPGTVVIIPDTLTTEVNLNTQVPLKDNPGQTNSLFNERPTNGNFGNSRDPQAGAPGTVVVLPDTLTIDENLNTQVPLKDNPGLFNERPKTGNFDNNSDPQAGASGAVIIIPDTLTIDENQNTQVPLGDNSNQTNSFAKERPINGNFDNSRDPQAGAPGTVVVLPDTLTIDENQNTQVPLGNNPDQANNVIKERPINGNFDNSRDPQAGAPGTVVVLPDTRTTDGNQNTQVPLRGNPDETNNFIKGRPTNGNFSNSRDPQAGAPGTIVIIPDTLTIDHNRNTEDPLRGDSVQPIGISKNQRPVFESSEDSNFTVAVTDSLVNTEIENDEIHLKDSFIPKPVAELDDEKFTDLNTTNNASLDKIRGQTVPLTDNIVTSEGFLTTPNPNFHHGAIDLSNYRNWPYHLQMPHQQKPNQNWQYPSQNGYYPSQNGHYPSQNRYYPNQNAYQTPHNVEINEQIEYDRTYNNPIRNSFKHYGQW